MKAIGKRSVSSFLLVFLNGASIFLTLLLIVATGLMVFSSIAGTPSMAVQIGAELSPNIEAGGNVHMSIPVAISVDPRTLSVTAPALGIDGAEFRDLQGSLRFAPRGGAFFVANFAVAIGGISFALWLLAQLRALFRALRDGQPFAPANATRVRRIAWSVILLEVVRSGVVYFENAYAMSHFVAEGLRFNARPHVNLFAIINGLIILAISEVFRAGTQLDEDQSLTV